MPPSLPYLTISPRGSHVVAGENSSVALTVRFKANGKSLHSEIEISQSCLAPGYPKKRGIDGGGGGAQQDAPYFTSAGTKHRCCNTRLLDKYIKDI